jgi:hypothetical protein
MSLRNTSAIIVMVLAAWVTPGRAEDKLGDLITASGYDWIVGRWAASTDQGQKVEFTFDWALDKCALLNGLQMGDFQYQGLITLAPTALEGVDQGVDSRGGTWKGTWSAGPDGLVRRVEHLGPDGQTRKGEIVLARVDADTITMAVYAVDSSGSRNAEPMSRLTYKRQPQAKAVLVSATAGTASRSTDYQKLGDVVAEGGYEWLIGKWSASQDNQTAEVEYQPILDRHAGSVNIKIGDFKYLGVVTYVASRQEIVEFGADNSGGTWKSVWEQEGSDAVNKSECTKSDGTIQKLQHVYTKIDNDSFKVKLYRVEAGGNRASEPRGEVTFQRQKPAAQAK